MSNLPLTDDFKSIVLNNTPLIDVRAPIEFEKGAFINATNLPLINDEERHLIGTKYKNEGNAEAVKLGFELVDEQMKEERVNRWLDFIQENPQAMLYCFRGGQRSKFSQMFIAERGVEITRLKGGYKAFRNYLIDAIDDSIKHFKPIILGGRTGSGKTILLHKIKNSIDLEGLANHRGSSFGRKTTPQPTQIDFENALAYDLIQKLDKGYKNLIFEDEGKFVGKVYIPKTFASYLANAPLIILETPIKERVEITFDEYIIKSQNDYEKMYKNKYLNKWENDIKSALDRIKKRLGRERHNIAYMLFENALSKQKLHQSLDSYMEFISYLLKEYYDPMYDYQIQKSIDRVAFRGSSSEVMKYIKNSI